MTLFGPEIFLMTTIAGWMYSWICTATQGNTTHNMVLPIGCYNCISALLPETRLCVLQCVGQFLNIFRDLMAQMQTRRVAGCSSSQSHSHADYLCPITTTRKISPEEIRDPAYPEFRQVLWTIPLVVSKTLGGALESMAAV